jgi:hypothetical protein
LGSDDDNLSFVVAACARPMMAGDKISAAADAFMIMRRLTGKAFMMFLPGVFDVTR